MDEYANILLILVCVMAITFPTIMVNTANTHSIAVHSGLRLKKQYSIILKNEAKAAALGPALMNAVMGVGAPS